MPKPSRSPSPIGGSHGGQTTASGTSPASPIKLRPYEFHGLSFQTTRDEALTDCPFCGKENKFSVNIRTGLWRCFVCQEGSEKGGGNIITFLRRLWDVSDRATNGQLDKLAKERGYLYPESLSHWGICQSVITKEWLVPGYNAEGKLCQLYKYALNKLKGKMLMYPTPWDKVDRANEVHHEIHRPATMQTGKPIAFVCEGPWDGIALWEVLKMCKWNSDDHLMRTGNSMISLMANAEVYAIPGCGSVGEPFRRWTSLFAGKTVYLLFDNDHPIHINGTTTEPAGLMATRKASNLLARSGETPKEIRYLKWGADSQYDLKAKSGLDVRDLLTASPDADARIRALEGILNKCTTIPSEWIQGRTLSAAADGGTEIECLPCTNWCDLVSAWQEAIKLTDSLDVTLSVMLACVVSTMSPGEQLWFKVIGPPSSGKTTLCQALAVNKKYVYSKSTIRGFHSGYRTDKDGEEDHGLIPKINGKTFVVKDADPLMQSPNKAQVLSEARDLFDCSTSSHYRNSISRDYHNIRTTLIWCGTLALKTNFDDTQLGERFLDCKVMDEMSDELEDEILDMVVERADRCMSLDGGEDLDPKLLRAMQLTGGYINYLRENDTTLLRELHTRPDDRQACKILGKFTSYMRSRPSKGEETDHESCKEFSPRLVVQFMRLAKCMAVVMNRRVLDYEVIRRVLKVAIDTSSAINIMIASYLYESGDKGVSARALALYTNQSEQRQKTMLQYMRKIGMVEMFNSRTNPGVAWIRWRLTDKMRLLWSQVMEGELLRELYHG